MTEAQAIPAASRSHPIPTGSGNLRVIPLDSAISEMRNLDLSRNKVFSPVNENGSFEFDKVLKSGELLKRTRKTKHWKSVYLVLRPNLLSMYKNQNESKLRHQVNLSDVTTVATRKDPKQKNLYVFSLFTPAKNYHFQASSESELRAWVDLIQREARVEEEEVELLSAGTTQPEPRFGSSPSDSPLRDFSNLPQPTRRFSMALEYSGNEIGSASDVSDSGPGKGSTRLQSPDASRPDPSRLNTQATTATGPEDDERVVWHGYMLRLKSHKGVRQWRKSWMVLRQKNMVLYKNEEEYRAELVVPMASVISAVEIDPISRSKRHCLQVIVEDKTYRFAAKDEEILARCLGSFKSILARRDAASPVNR